VDHTSGTTSTDTPAAPGSQPVEPAASGQPGFGSRGRARRRARFLRKARELAYRDLGGLVFNLHRFGQRNDALVLAKLSTIGHIDTELRTIETALRERRSVTVLREAGITACPRCAAIHASEDRFCPNCGLPMTRHADLPIAGAPVGTPDPVPQPPQPTTPQAPPQAGPPPSSSPAAPTPAAPAPTPVASGTAPVPPPSEGRSPAPPSQTRSTSAEESTEILRPQAPSS
jgi:hypothetical protein